jgi:hypothetical protein
MKIEDGSTRYSIIIAGVLGLMVLSIFILVFSSAWNINFYPQNNPLLLGGGLESSFEEKNENEDEDFGIKIGPVAQKGRVDCLDTEQGYIKVIDKYFDYPLPLHLSEEEINDWYVELEVRGGHDPLDGYIDIYQGKEGYKGRLWMEWNYLGLRPSWFEFWNVTFKPEGDIFLDSNVYPEFDNDWFSIDKEGEIPGKDVSFDVWTLWTGCGEDDQHFEIILVQSLCFQNPHSRNKFELPFEILFIKILRLQLDRP